MKKTLSLIPLLLTHLFWSTLAMAAVSIVTGRAVLAQGAIKHGDHRARKSELDAAAQAAGFHGADYPFYSAANGCGPDGWKNKAVPDCVGGASFSAACNQHDRDYMQVGFERKQADDRMLQAMLAAHTEWLKENVKTTVTRTVNREVKRVVENVVNVPKQVWSLLKPKWTIFGPVPQWGWKLVTEPHTVATTVLELVPSDVQEVSYVTRDSLLAPAQVAAQQEAIKLYYLALRTLGEEYYQDSQAKQAEYEAWVAEYLRSH